MIGATHHVVEQENRQNHHRERDGAEHPEHGAPAQRVYEEAADGRADGGREPDDHAHDGRGLAILAFRVDVQRHQLHERQADAGAAGLQQARRQQAGIVRREDGRSAPDGERRHGREEQLLGVEPVHQITRHGADQAQYENVCRGEQLAGACADAVLVHDRRQRGDHHALGDARRRGARHHDAQHHATLPRRQAVALGFGIGFGVGCSSRRRGFQTRRVRHVFGIGFVRIHTAMVAATAHPQPSAHETRTEGGPPGEQRTERASRTDARGTEAFSQTSLPPTIASHIANGRGAGAGPPTAACRGVASSWA